MAHVNESRERKINRYVDAVNAALTANGDRPLYRFLIRVCDRRYGDTDLGVAVYKHVPDHPYDYFTLRWNHGSLEVHEHGKTDEVAYQWLLPVQHIEHVLDAPQKFERRPVRLQVDWMLTRLRTEAAIRRQRRTEATQATEVPGAQASAET